MTDIKALAASILDMAERDKGLTQNGLEELLCEQIDYGPNLTATEVSERMKEWGNGPVSNPIMEGVVDNMYKILQETHFIDRGEQKVREFAWQPEMSAKEVQEAVKPKG